MVVMEPAWFQQCQCYFVNKVILRVIRTHYLLYAWFPHLAVNVIEKRFVWWMSQTNADFDPEDRGSRETVT